MPAADVPTCTPFIHPHLKTMRYDTIIAGGGLVGACAALVLSRTERVLLLEAEQPASGASGAAAGLVNPFMARKARPTWRMVEALAALHALLDEADAAPLFRPTGVLRPARSPKQAAFFQTTAAAHPHATGWLAPDAVLESAPSVRSPHGALWVRRGGAIDVPAMINAFLKAATDRGAEIRTGARVTSWGEDDDAAWVEVAQRGEMQRDETQRLRAGRLLLALGQGYPAFPELEALGLHSVKGQTVRVRRPGVLRGPLPSLSGYGYVVPDGETLLVGSSYDHDFADLSVSPAVTERLLARASAMLPGLETAEVVDERAGARVKRKGSRLPVIGPLPGRARLWTFTALGSKGLLTAPLLTRDLPHFFDDPASIPSEARPPRGSASHDTALFRFVKR